MRALFDISGKTALVTGGSRGIGLMIARGLVEEHLADETADQCGPCVNGLAALAETMERVAASQAALSDIDRVWRWTEMVRGRGACHHPDGAVGQLSSALTVFKDHLRGHLNGQRCYGAHVDGFPEPPEAGEGWR